MKLLNAITKNIPELLFVAGLVLLSVGIFKVGVIPGLISTGAMLILWSVLMGGD